MGEIVARNMQSKAIAENKNAIVASCWTYFTTMIYDSLKHQKYFVDVRFKAFVLAFLMIGPSGK